MKDEEVRRIQLTGRTTYIVSLPKKWVLEMGLKAGSQVLVSRKGGSLIITPKDLAKVKAEPQEAVLKISGSDNPDKIVRAVIALYLNGYSSIIVRSSDQITQQQRNAISELMRRRIVGTEVISDSPREMVLKVLVGHLELSLASALRRMYLVTSSMFEGAIKALIDLDKELAKSVVELDDEVDRFGFYIIRQLKAAVQNSKVLEDIGLENPRECLGYRVVVKFIERIADHATRIAKNVLLLNEKLDDFVLKRASSMSILAKSLLEKSMKSLFERNYDLAEEVVSEARKMALIEEETMKAITERSGETFSSTIKMILGDIRRIGEYSGDIAEVVLNLNVDKLLVT
ncbi:MAG: phosphate uptake regulator PhoU [Candidatus Nezhaarchaeota archaeon]|nr:phosphate uptake regulator PhoU [Candidatus Nezhaarchaeota archaeon]